MLNAFVTLAMRTLTDTRAVAQELLDMRISRPVLWLALALAVVLNALIYQVSLVLSPPAGPLPMLFASPLIFAMLIGGGLVLSIFATTYAGRALGGKATLEGIMTLLVWLQFLRFAVQIVSFVLMPIMPGLVAVLVLSASLYGIWLLLQFVDVAHEFNSLFVAFGALMLSGLAIMIGLAIILSMLGIQNMGLIPNV